MGDLQRLTRENFRNGFLVDDEWLGGVTESPDRPGHFLAYVLSQASGAYLGCHAYPDLEQALAAMNRIPRAWAFESTSGCGGGKCGKPGGCVGESCKRNAARGGDCAGGC